MTQTPVGSTEIPDEPVQVRFLGDRPLAVRWQGRIWPVAPGPVQRNRPESAMPCSPAGTDAWQVQVRLDSATALRTLEIRRDPGQDGWRLVRVTDST